MAADKFEKLKPMVLKLYSLGYTRQKIADSLNITNGQAAYIIYSLLKVHKNRPRKMSSTNLVESMPKQLVNRVITLASWGYNMKEIAEDTRLPYNRVHVLVREATDKELIKKMI